MQASDIPSKFPIPFANAAGGGYIRAIPEASQVGIQNGAASLTDGFPPLTFLPVGSGGTPPFGQDFNGVLKQVTQWNQWQGAGSPVTYDLAFSAGNGGYPQGAVLASTTPGKLWINLVDNNTSNPDAGGANWQGVATLANIKARAGFSNLTGSRTSTKFALWAIGEITAETALGGTPYFGSNLNLSFNGATVGAGGMDTGGMPASGDISIYAIYNPTANAWSTLGVAGSTSRGTIYSGAHMPSGYTASVLIHSSVTTSGADFYAFLQSNNTVWTPEIALATGLSSATPAAIPNLAVAVPVNAKTWLPGGAQTSTVAASNLFFTPANSTTSAGTSTIWSGVNNSLNTAVPVPFISPQTAFYFISAGQTWNIFSAGFTF